MWTQRLCISAKTHTVNNSDWVLSQSTLLSAKNGPFWETQRGQVTGKPKENHKVGLSVASKLIWPVGLSAASTLASTFCKWSTCIFGNIRHTPIFMSHLAAVSRWASIRSSLQHESCPAFIRPFFFFFFYMAADGETHTHTFADTHAATPWGAISPPLSTFPVFHSQFLLIWHQLPHAPRVHLKVAFI